MSKSPLVVENLSFRYQRRKDMAIEKISFELSAGKDMLIAGASGCGKTTLTRCINGLIPHTYNGEMSGDIRLFGKSVKEMPMAQISQTVGTLLQDPERPILGSYVLNEVAFGLESLGIPREDIVPRVEKALDRLGFSSPTRRGETLDLSPEDARTYGVAPQERVRVVSRRGAVTVPVYIDPTLRPEFQTLPLRATPPGGGPVRWGVDGRPAGTSRGGGAVMWPLARGRHVVAARDRGGRTAEVTILVK